MGKTLSLGINLRSARKKKGWDIPSVSKELCISKRYLRALEEDDKDALPKTTFAVGFLRSYANHLGLDANGLVKTAKGFYGQAVAINEVSVPETTKDSRMPRRPLMFTIVGSLIGLYGTWFIFSGGGGLRAELTPPVPDHLSKLIANEYVDPSGLSNLIENALSENSEIPEVVFKEEAKLTPSDLPETLNINSIGDNEEHPNQSISELFLKDGLNKNMTLSFLEVKADKDTWVMIKTAENKILMEGILKVGKIFSSPKGDALFLTTGDAGAIKITVDGKTSNPIGENGVVLKDVNLSKFSEKPNSDTPTH